MFQISPWMHFSMDEATATRRHLVQHSMPKAKQSLTREEVEFACKQLSKKLCLGDREATNWHERALAASVSSRAGLRDTAPECDREVLDACLHKIRYILNGASKATRRQESALVSKGQVLPCLHLTPCQRWRPSSLARAPVPRTCLLQTSRD